MTNYRNIEIKADAAGGHAFKIGMQLYGADTIGEAHIMIDDVLADCWTHRGISVAPGDDSAAEFEVAGLFYQIQAPTADARRIAAEAVIDRLLDTAN